MGGRMERSAHSRKCVCRIVTGSVHNLVSMNAPLYPNRRRVSGLSEDGKADRVVDKKGMGKSEMSPREYLSRWIPAKSCSSGGDNMAVHDVDSSERRANMAEVFSVVKRA